MPFKRSDLIPYKIPENWNWVILGSVASFLNGRAYKKSELLDDNKLTPVLRVGNLFTNSKWYYSDLKLDSNKYIDKGDLIYAWSASFGPRIWQGGHVIYHYHIWKVNFNKSLVDKKFLEYFLSDERNVLGETKVHGSTMKHITKTNMEHLPFPLPPLTEQKRIVTKLEKLMPLVDEYEKAYNRLKSIDDGFNDKMKQSILQYAMEGKLVKQNSNDEPASELLKKIKDEKNQLVKEKKIKRSKSLPRISEDEKLFDIPENWEWVRLKDITNFGNFNSVAGQDIQEGSWVLNMEDIIKNGGGFNKFTIKKLNDDFKSNKYIVEVGDVLYGKLRPYLRKIEIAPKNGFTTTEMFPIKVINQNLISPYYLRYVMLSPYFANRINGSTYGMKMPRVGTKYLASMLIPLPPFEEQKRIVTKVEKMMALVK